MAHDGQGGRVCPEMCCYESERLKRNSKELFELYLRNVKLSRHVELRQTSKAVRWMTRHWQMRGSPEFEEYLAYLVSK
jgi:hypothetical protein